METLLCWERGPDNHYHSGTGWFFTQSKGIPGPDEQCAYVKPKWALNNIIIITTAQSYCPSETRVPARCPPCVCTARSVVSLRTRTEKWIRKNNYYYNNNIIVVRYRTIILLRRRGRRERPRLGTRLLRVVWGTDCGGEKRRFAARIERSIHPGRGGGCSPGR